MEDQVKDIISRYTKIPVDQINQHTLIGRTAVASSIVLHRMYAQLATDGFAAENYAGIKTYGDLLAALNKTSITALSTTAVPVYQYSAQEQSNTIGIDIENISNMPPVNDFRLAEFYTMNFSPAEIAYCILQPDPYASFAGLFAAKEAIIKADNAYRSSPFNSIIIDHLPSGKPVYPGFRLSISHTNDLTIAVAVKNSDFSATGHSHSIASTGGNALLLTFTAMAALLLSLLSLLLFLYKSC